jgi:MFS family permease
MLLVLCGAIFLDALNVSMMGVALPSIGSDLGMSTSSLQWVVSAYVLGYGGFLLLGGRVADLIGRRQVFLASLAVFIVFAGLGGLANDGPLLIAVRFITGVSAAFTTPAGLSILTTSFDEGPARNRAITIYSATGAAGFSLGLVLGGLLTEISWRWVFMVPVVLAIGILAAAIPLIPKSNEPRNLGGGFDIAGAVTATGALLLLVYTLVEAPNVGWVSARTLGSLVAVAALLTVFTTIERRVANPMLRLGILRSGSLIRANIAAMSLLGAWVGAQFIAILYMQNLRGWSAIETGLAVFPAGLIVALLATRLAGPLVARFGTTLPILAGMVSGVIGYALLLRLGADSNYLTVLLPAFVFNGLAFALSYGPVTMAATNGIAPEEHGLAGGLINTSFQIGPAIVLAVATAVNDSFGSETSPAALLDGYRAAIVVSLIVAVIGAGTILSGFRLPRPVPVPAVAGSSQLCTEES